jgi:hypothetical protein
MKVITAAVLSVMLFVSLALIPAIGSAQNVGQSTNTYSNSSADTGTSLLNGSTNGTGSRFDPMWLLPLLIVPVAFVIYKAANNDLMDTTYRGGTSFAGVKGGKSSKKADEDDHEDRENHKS